LPLWFYSRYFIGSGEDIRLVLHFEVPTTINNAPFDKLYLTIGGGWMIPELLTPLLTWQVDDGLEAMLEVSQTRYNQYSLFASYTPTKGCPPVATLNLKGNQEIEDHLDCVREFGWAKCAVMETEAEAARKKSQEEP